MSRNSGFAPRNEKQRRLPGSCKCLSLCHAPHISPMGLFAKFKAGLQKTHSKLAHEIKRIVTRSPKLDAAALEELEAALIGADLGMAVTTQIVNGVKKAYETQGSGGLDVFGVAEAEVLKSLSSDH